MQACPWSLEEELSKVPIWSEVLIHLPGCLCRRIACKQQIAPVSFLLDSELGQHPLAARAMLTAEERLEYGMDGSTMMGGMNGPNNGMGGMGGGGYNMGGGASY